MPLRQTAAADMENAIKEMKSQGVHSYILDLQNNPVTFILISFFFLVDTSILDHFHKWKFL